MQTIDPQLIDLFRQYDAADRLQAIASRIGLALWHLQDVEASSAMCFAMMAKATKGMGIEAGYALLKDAQSKPFGSIIDRLSKARILSPELQVRFDILREERNWLVHRSHEASRSAVHQDDTTWKLLTRLERLTQEALALHKELEKLAWNHAIKHGASREEIMAEAQQSLEVWRSGKTT